MDQQQAVNVNAEAQTVRSAIAQCFALADTANHDAALERVNRLYAIFTGYTQDAVKEAISLTKATKAGIKAKSTMYNRLSQSKAFYQCFLANQWDAVAADKVRLTIVNDDGSEEIVEGSDWNLRYKLATTLNRARNEEASMERKISDAVPIARAVLLTQGIEATDDKIGETVAASIQRQAEMLEAMRGTPTETAKRTVKSQWKDKGSDWCIRFAEAYALEVGRLVEEQVKGAVNQPTQAHMIPPSAEDVQAGEQPAPGDLQTARDVAAAARKALASARHATPQGAAAPKTGTGG